MFHSIKDSLLSLTYPQFCENCRGSVESTDYGVACKRCWEKTHFLNSCETLCYKCQKFLASNPSPSKTFCHRCDEHFYDLARSVGRYEGALAASILNLKKQPFVPNQLKKFFLKTLRNSPFERIDCVVPVPLSKKRLIERGFNQASLLSRLVVKQNNLELNEKCLFRIKHSKVHRAGMDKKGRDLSVKNAFEVRNENLIAKKNILLIDDVFTSGATISYCAKVLKKAGAQNVYVLTIARAV